VPSEIRTDVVDPKTRSARALVRVRHGHTLVLGGLIDRSQAATLKQVPLFSDIPFIGRAFQDKERNDIATELIVFVTPKILQETMGNKVDWQHGAEYQEPSLSIREQDPAPSRQEMIEDTMNRLDTP
jgi:type II secretory pathway component GspD/PulD (secretin)